MTNQMLVVRNKISNHEQRTRLPKLNFRNNKMCMCVCIYTLHMCKLKLQQSRKFFSPAGVYVMYNRATTLHENSSLNCSIFIFEYAML